jgi:hypothetical protein
VLDAGESTSLEATLLMDHVPAAGVEPFAYSGRIIARSDSGSASIPFAVIKSPRLVVRLNGQSPQYVLMHDRSSVWSMVEATNSYASFLVPEGTYDLIASFGGEATRVVREGVLVSDSVDVSISQSEAIYEIRRAELDERGAPLAATSGFMDFRHKSSTIGVYTLGSVPSVMHYSPVSAEYELQWLASDSYTNTVTHVVNGYLRGIHQSRVFTNTPVDLRHIACRYHPPPGIAEVTPLPVAVRRAAPRQHLHHLGSRHAALRGAVRQERLRPASRRPGPQVQSPGTRRCTTTLRSIRPIRRRSSSRPT